MGYIDSTFMDDGSDHLEHYGVKGMHWGVRSSETLQRYSRERKAHKARKADARNIKRKRVETRRTQKKQEVVNRERRASIKAERIAANKNRSLLSDAELNRRISRLQRERQLRELTNSELKPGRTAIKNALTGVGTSTVKGTSAHVIKTYTPLKVKTK